MDDVASSNCVAHLGKCRNILPRVGAEDYEVGVHAFRDASRALGFSELSRRIGGEGGEDLQKAHACLRHKGEF
jgi:hypothetical protein